MIGAIPHTLQGKQIRGTSGAGHPKEDGGHEGSARKADGLNHLQKDHTLGPKQNTPQTTRQKTFVALHPPKKHKKPGPGGQTPHRPEASARLAEDLAGAPEFSEGHEESVPVLATGRDRPRIGSQRERSRYTMFWNFCSRFDRSPFKAGVPF